MRICALILAFILAYFGPLAFAQQSNVGTAPAAEALDYTTRLPLKLDISLGDSGVKETLVVNAGESLREKATSFVQAYSLPNESVETIFNALVELGMAPKIAARVHISVNGDEKEAIMYQGEDPAAAARRFMQSVNLDKEGDLDALLRILINRFRAMTGHTDGFPLTTEERGTVAYVDLVVSEEKTYRLRLLEGESIEVAAAGFLYRMGFPHEENIATVTNKLVQRVDEVLKAQEPPAPKTPSAPQSSAISLSVTYDTELPPATLVYIEGQDPVVVASAFLESVPVKNPETKPQLTQQLAQAIAAKWNASRAVPAPAAPAQTAKPAKTYPSANKELIIPVSLDGTDGFDLILPPNVPVDVFSTDICLEHWSLFEAPFLQVWRNIPANKDVTQLPSVDLLKKSCIHALTENLSAYVSNLK